jgi:hypothetical protein
LSLVNKADIHVTNYGEYGFGISSPQLTTLVGGAATIEELEADMMEIAVGAGLSPKGSFVIHFQNVVVVDEDTYVIRVKNDYYVSERAEVAQSIDAALRTDANLRSYASPDSAGDFVFVATLGREKLRAVLDSLDVTEPATLAVRNDATGEVDCIGLLRRVPASGEHLRTLEGLGLPEDATLNDMISATRATAQAAAEKSGIHERELVLF